MKDRRSKAILEASVRGFIKTGKPITSENLYESYDFGIKPAMIRWELNDLSDEGYFFQTHPSGGRFPTAKAYRFFIQEIFQSIDDFEEKYSNEIVRDCVKGFMKGEKEYFVRQVANCLNGCGIGYDRRSERIYESGLAELLEHIDSTDKSELIHIVEDMEQIPERLEKKREWLDSGEIWPKVFIGKNPLTRSESLSLIMSRFNMGGEEFLLVGVNPLRTDYQRALSLFRSLASHLDRF